jgi:hypothetical protein
MVLPVVQSAKAGLVTPVKIEAFGTIVTSAGVRDLCPLSSPRHFSPCRIVAFAPS